MRIISLITTLSVLLFVTSAQGEQKTHFSEYAVVAGEAQAAQAGAQIIEQGGSAADAAAAAMLTLGLTSPMSSGFAGGGWGLYYDAKTAQTVFLDFRERAPKMASPNMFVKQKNPAEASRIGGLAVAVPGEPKGIEQLVKRFGKLDLEHVTAPARRLAENGFYLSGYFVQMAGKFKSQIYKDPYASTWFNNVGRIEAGTVQRNPALAEVLACFAREGSSCFYTGKVAKAMVAEIKKRGGVLSLEDLKDYQVFERQTLSAEHFGYEFVTAPAPSAGGYIMLASLGLLEEWLGKRKPSENAEWYHMLAESWKGPFIDRTQYITDPVDTTVLMSELLNPARIAKRAKVFNRQTAQEPEKYDVPLGERARKNYPAEDHGTSHVCVVDKEGNVASFTTSVNLPFGAGFSVHGMFMNDTMDDFNQPGGASNAFGLHSGELNQPKPGRTPVSSTTPTIVFKNGKPVMCVGGSGGSRIVTAVEQAALRVLLMKRSVLDAVTQPRIHHQAMPNEISYEDMDAKTMIALTKMKHKTSGDAPFSGAVQMIHIGEGKTRSLEAASDPRKQGYAAGR